MVLLAASQHLEKMSTQVESLKVKTGAQRLSGFLVEQWEKESSGNLIELPFEKVVLAGKLGMKPESLSRAFKRLKRMGVICEKKSVSIEDVSKLKAFSSEGTEKSYTAA